MFLRSSFALSALLLPTISGCGLILGGGSRQTIQISSVPPGAKFTTTPPTATYTTPASINLERKSSYTLTFEMAGYTTSTFPIQTNVRAGYVIADVLLTGLVGVLVDAMTGGWSALSPKTATVSLTKTAMIDGPNTIDIAVTIDGNKNAVRIQSTLPGVRVRVTPTR